MTSSNVSRRGLLRTAALGAGTLALGGGLSACGSGSPSSSADALTYWDWYVTQAPWVDKEIELFEKGHSGVSVKKTTQQNAKYPDLVALANRSGNPPDVFMIPQVPSVAEQVAKGWLYPLDEWATPAWQSRFPEGTFLEGANVFDGKVYSAPLKGSGPQLQLYIHHGVFKSVGLTNPDGSVKIPRTWDEVTSAAQTITKKSGGKSYGFGFGNADGIGVLAWWLDLFVRGAGAPGGAPTVPGTGMDYRVGKWTFGTDRAYADFLELFVEWKKRGFFHPNSVSLSDEAARAFFERGKFGMTVGGVWNQPEWTQHKFTDYSLVTLPSPTTTPKGFYYADPVGNGTFAAVSAKSKKAHEGFQWLDALTSPAAGRRWVQDLNGVSAHPADNDPDGIDSKPFAAFIGMTEQVLRGPVPLVRNPELAGVAPGVPKPDISDVVTGVYTGQIKDVQGALTSLADKKFQLLSDAVAAVAKQGKKVSTSDYVFPDWDPTKPYTTKKKA
ncbi:ABC transporter substrate-binding protein [Streptomyces sp. NBC_00986]|uniref:ABC transporter substrate-binding protein n=1 Tax=Streptomyces sp. NBC_00986 TaxID=2903702 RepID=UPI00386CBA7F|nr:extracellular solute-binding protein [Streptomyces sp. NBC_00986]